MDLFETVIQAADVIDSTDAQRKLAVTARLQAEEARATLLSKSEVQRRAELSSYRDAEATQGKAFAHFEAGNFGDARTAWAAAATGFTAALAESSAAPGSDASKRIAEATERIQPTEPTPPTTPQPVETSSVQITSRKEWHPIIRVKRGQTMKIEVSGSWEFSRLDFVERLSGKIFPSGASFVIGKGGEFEAKADGLLFIGIGSRRRLYPNIPGSVTARVLLYPAAKAEDPPVPQAAQGTVDLLALIDPAQDAFNGIWGGGKSKPLAADGYARLRIPYEPPAEYDFSVIFSKKPNEGRRRVQLWFSQGDRQWTCGVEINNDAKAASFLFPAAGEVLRGPDVSFEYGTMHSMIVKVRNGSVAVLLDDRPLSDWRFDASEQMVAPYDSIGPGVLGIGARGEVMFHRVELVAVTPGGGAVQSAAMHQGKVFDQLTSDNNDAREIPEGAAVTRRGPVGSQVALAEMEDVVLLHPSRENSPVTLIFTSLTRNSDGTLRLQLHGPGNTGGRAELLHKGKTEPVRIEGNTWIPAEVKFARGDQLTLSYYPDPGAKQHLYVSCELTLEGRRAAGAATTQPE